MKTRPEDFRAPFIKQSDAWAEADRFRALHWPGADVPVDVERVLWSVNLRLEPLQGLKQTADVDALLRGDFTTIVVDNDEYMDDRMQNRIRFSIAHELGHFVLHSDVYRTIPYGSVEEWIEFVQRVPEDQWSYFEMHANEFAGRLLVPLERLKSEVILARQKAEAAGFTKWEESGDAVREYIGGRIGRTFGVSSQVIEKRIIRERLL